MLIRRTVALVALVCALSACEPSSHGSPTPKHDRAPEAASAPHGVGGMYSPLKFNDTCLDDKTLPCIELQRGNWYLIASREPKLNSYKLHFCDVEDGGKLYPCIWVSKHPAKAKYDYLVYLERVD